MITDFIAEYERINSEWAVDANDFNDNFDPLKHSKDAYKLHQKYSEFMNRCMMEKHNLDSKLKKLENLKFEYYNGDLTLDQIKKLGWPIQAKKMLKADIARAIVSDSQIISLTKTIGECITTIKYCESIVDSLKNRSFLISNYVNYQKFMSGG